MDAIVVKAIISRGNNGDSSIPEIPPYTILAVGKRLMVDSTIKLSKQDWKMEQEADSDIGSIVTLINNKALCSMLQREKIPLA